MTREEFNLWYDDLKIKIPGSWEWAEKLVDTKQTLMAWYEVAFADLDLPDVLEVTTMLVMGDLTKPYGSDIPALYRREAKKLRFARRAPEPEYNSKASDGAWSYVKGSCGAAYRKALDIIAQEKANGATSEEAVATMKGMRQHEWVSLL